MSRFAVELRATAVLAWPMALAQLAQVAMMATDLAFVGRLGPRELAAAALATTLYVISFTFGAGLLTPIAPLTAQSLAGKGAADVPRALRMGLWLALLFSLPIMAVCTAGEQVLLALGQEHCAARLSQQYLLGLAWGVTPALWFQAIRHFMGAVGRPQPIFRITLAAIPVNAAIVYLLGFGKLGLPPLDLLGVGIATALVNWGMFVAALWPAIACRPFRDYQVLAHLWHFDWPLLRAIILIGAPISVAVIMQYGVFAAAALLVGRISPSALAAHQITMQIATIAYTVPFGISMAAAVRVSHAVGHNDASGIKRAGLAAILLGVLASALVTVGVIATRFRIAAFFLNKSLNDTDTAIGLTSSLLMVASSFFVADAAQVIAGGGLRGLKDTAKPLLFAIFAYWLIGFPVSFALSWVFGAIGVWIGLSAGAITYAGFLVTRFLLLASRFTV
ncbi:putative multidrug resistance protein NorM [Bradyrhizobium guangdongense]|uniref:Multidrug resistance protein NorM n=1 Tax=Bradyrhizobium guangdongense TaxID=1325090 RepID=A0AA88BCU5_9BRAD|nr:putative multidrug resistance protein NorM [Bradyrhizobium guangdongense]